MPIHCNRLHFHPQPFFTVAFIDKPHFFPYTDCRKFQNPHILVRWTGREVFMKKPGLWQKFSNLVSDSSSLMTRVGQVALLVVCNLCWLICSLPGVTMGAASAALYAVLLERRGMSFDGAFLAFFRAFRRCWRTATLLWLPALVLGTVWLWAAWLTAAQGLVNNAFALLPLLVSGAVWAFAVAWAFPLVAAGVQGTGQVLRKALLLGLSELWRSALMLVLDLLPLVLFLLYAQTFMVLAGFWVLLGFALIALVKLLVMEPVLRRHTPLGKQ